MNAQGGVTAEELVRALKRRRATLPAEIGTFVALETCEAMLEKGPRAVSLATVRISEEGTLSLEDAAPADEETAAHALHALLTSLLVAAGPAPAPLLMRLVEEGPSGGVWALAPLRDELEASLVPLNRTASRRVLSRLVRETGWADRPNQAKGPSFRELDAELSSILGVEPPPAEEEPPAESADRDRTVPEPVQDVEASGDILYFDQPADGLAAASAITTSKATPLFADEPMPVAVTSLGGAPQLRDLDSLDQGIRPRGSRGLVVGLGLVVLAAALVGITLVLRPDALARLSGDAPTLRSDAADEPLVVHKKAVGGELVVRVTPERAQVFRFVGRGPATVPHLPVGVAHEFVAILDGAKPTRALIPPSGEWESLPEGPRYELAMQLAEQAAPSVTLDLGDTLLPKNVGAPTGTLGSARIVTTPRGAKVYQLIGFAPEVRVEDLPLDGTEELLVYLPGHAHVVRVVTPSDFHERDGRRVAQIDIALTPLKRRN